MNREIKFRAWDELKKRYNYFDFEHRNVHRNLCKGFVIEQYTGRKDKNGKEIYHDDLMKSDKGVIFRVIWNERKTGWIVVTKNIWNYNDRKYFKSFNWAIDKCEVIGNIYENKDLL